jgi:hypothetical protein
VSWLAIVLLAAAVAVLAAAEWPRLEGRFGAPARRRRSRQKQKANLRLLRSESEDFEASVRQDLSNFEASVQRDLSKLPTIEEHPRDRRSS